MSNSVETSALMLDHAAGHLSPALALVAESHMALNEAAKSDYAAFEAAGGSLLAEMEEAALDEHALDHLFARLERPVEQEETETSKPAVSFDAETVSKVPEPVLDLLPGNLKSIRWRKRGGGVREFILNIEDEAYQASLLAIEPGRAIPNHTHKGTEYTVVLDGSYTDEGVRVCAGDLVVHDAEDTHKPIADEEIGCLCLAVLSAPLKFQGPFGFILNRLQ